MPSPIVLERWPTARRLFGVFARHWRFFFFEGHPLTKQATHNDLPNYSPLA